MLMMAVGNLSAQTYNGTTWYSLYDAAEHSKYTTTSVNNNITICTHSVFTPSTDNNKLGTWKLNDIKANAEYDLIRNYGTLDKPFDNDMYIGYCKNLYTNYFKYDNNLY